MFGEKSPGRSLAVGLFHVAAMLLVLAPAVPGRAAEERAVKSRVALVYPELAKRMHITGVVKVEATVDADGKVSDVRTLSGSRTLAPAAEDAVRKWKFVPGSEQSMVDVDVKFELAH